MKFEPRQLHESSVLEYGVYAVDPRQGNDAALLAVFDNPRSSQELARFLNWAYDLYLRDAPMEAATETRISPGGSRPAEQSLPEGWIRTGPQHKCPEHQW